MKQEFITVRGKVFIEKDTLFVKTLNHDANTFLFKIFLPLLTLGLFVYFLFTKENTPGDNFRVFMWGLFCFVQLPKLYESLIMRSHSNRIPLNRIVSDR